MRFNFSILLLVMLLFCDKAMSQKDSISSSKKQKNKAHNVAAFLQLSGKIKELQQYEKAKELALDSVSIEVFDSNKKRITKVLYTKKKYINIKLKLGEIYTIKISKDNYVSKFFEVNTFVPKDKLRVYNFTFEVFLFKHEEGVDYTLLQKPVAIIEFKPKTEKFDYDYEYTNQVNKELKRQYKDLYYLKKE